MIYTVPLYLSRGGGADIAERYSLCEMQRVMPCYLLTYLVLKVELEALAGFGDDFLADFLVDKIVVRKGIATHGGEHLGGELSLRDGF